MNEEIIEEVVIDSVDEISDSVELVDSVEEIESVDEISSDELVYALLQLLNEQNYLDQENIEEETIVNELNEDCEPVPLLVQSIEPTPDYTDLLNSLNDRLESVETLLIENNTPKTLDTPLSEYSLDSVLLVGVLIVLGLTLGYQFLKDNFLKF